MKSGFKFRRRTVAAVIVSVLCLGATVSVGASSKTISVFLSDEVSIEIDGKAIPLPDGYHVLNYQDRVYTPARLVAETMGAKVDYDDAGRRVIIASPPAKVEYVPAPETPEPDKAAQSGTAAQDSGAAQIIGTPVPAKVSYSNITLNVFGIVATDQNSILNVDITNDNAGNQCLVDINDAYIEYDGARYTADPNYNQIWKNGIIVGQPVKDAQMSFQKLPVDRPNRLKVCIPITLFGDSAQGNLTQNFIEYVDFTDQ